MCFRDHFPSRISSPPATHAEKSLTRRNKESGRAPAVLVAAARQAEKNTDLILPGNIQPITEAAILARAGGYLVKRYADIGDRVAAGQLLAEIDTPEFDQQVRQAQATLQQTRAALAQAQANLAQDRANAGLARVTAERNSTLVTRGSAIETGGRSVERDYNAQVAAVEAGSANVAAAQQNVSAAQAELQRLTEMQGFKRCGHPSRALSHCGIPIQGH